MMSVKDVELVDYVDVTWHDPERILRQRNIQGRRLKEDAWRESERVWLTENAHKLAGAKQTSVSTSASARDKQS